LEKRAAKKESVCLRSRREGRAADLQRREGTQMGGGFWGKRYDEDGKLGENDSGLLLEETADYIGHGSDKRRKRWKR
jgi:hypothetical protein